MVYYRVSTTRQAEKDLSLPEQQRQVRLYCETKGIELVDEYVEPGASAKDDNRPVFRKMIQAARSAEKPFDLIVVYNLSRFFRDATYQDLYVRELQRKEVGIASVTEEIDDTPTGDLTRRLLGMIYQYENTRRAKNVTDAMIANARQGFWNGSRPPFGYRTVEAERRGDTIKKRLAVDPEEAELVRWPISARRPWRGLKARTARSARPVCGSSSTISRSMPRN